MAIARGAGTEIIRSAHFEDIDDTTRDLIVGVQHHIYTVLSIIIIPDSLQASGNIFYLKLLGYDALEGGSAGSAETISIANIAFTAAGETFVWNDKFSFNGHEPTAFTGPMDDATKQDAIADQGNASVAQKLQCSTSNPADSFEVHITYIDQNNA